MQKNKVIGLTAVAMIVVGLTAVVGVLGLTKVSAQVSSLMKNGMKNGEVPAIITNLRFGGPMRGGKGGFMGDR
jgi:L-asparagine transporter-like permease